MPFEADRAVPRTSRHVVGGVVDVRIAEDEQRARRRAVDEPRRSPRARATHVAFGADQRARDVEAVLGQQLVEVVAGDAARDVREARADQVGVAVAQRRAAAA